MSKRRNITLLSGALMVVAVGWACARLDTPAAPDVGTPSFWAGEEEVQCPIRKFTGGGRIDPVFLNSLSGKVTFGFNIHLDQNCGVIKGELQTVHHPTKTRYHSHLNPSETTAEPSEACATAGFEGGLLISGIVRVKHGSDSWETHTFQARFCDNGEPGSSPGTGPDTYRFKTTSGSGPGHGDTGDATGDTPLTGGNIQAH